MFDMILPVFHFFGFNLPLILFCTVGLLTVRFGKGSWGWYVFAVLLELHSLHGTMLMKARVPEQWDPLLDVGDHVSAFLLLALFFFLIRRALRNRGNNENV